MTEHELDAVKKAVEQSLRVGAPGVSDVTRYAIANVVIRRLRHQFNVPAPPLPVAPQERQP